MIIFGDHTRVLKYVDEPFFIGADGVKILKPKTDEHNYKYLFYALKNVSIPDTGYNRHFKWLKDAEIKTPDLQTQEYIVEILDRVDDLVRQRESQLAKLDQLVKARFVEMFGDPLSPDTKITTSTLGEKFRINSGGTPSTNNSGYWENGDIPWVGSSICQDSVVELHKGKFITKEGLEHSSAKIFEDGTVLVALVGATIGKTALLRYKTAINQNIAAIEVADSQDFIPEFVFIFLQHLYGKFEELGHGKFKMANLGFVRSLPIICPPRSLQEDFATFVQKVDKSKAAVKQSLEKLETLKKSLMQEYFG